MNRCEEMPTIAGGTEIEVFTPGAELFVSFFRITIDLGESVSPLVRDAAATALSDVGLALEVDSFE